MEGELVYCEGPRKSRVDSKIKKGTRDGVKVMIFFLSCLLEKGRCEGRSTSDFCLDPRRRREDEG